MKYPLPTPIEETWPFSLGAQFLAAQVSITLGLGYKLVKFPTKALFDKIRADLLVVREDISTSGTSSNFLTSCHYLSGIAFSAPLREYHPHLKNKMNNGILCVRTMVFPALVL